MQIRKKWLNPGAYLGFCQGGCTFLADLPPPPDLDPDPDPQQDFELDPDPQCCESGSGTGSGTGSGRIRNFWPDPIQYLNKRFGSGS